MDNLTEGKLRDHMAAIMDEADGTLAALEKISNSLTPELRQRLDDGRADMDAWADSLEQHWNHVIAGVMLCHVRNLDVLNEAYQMMLEQDRITSGQLLDVMNDKMQLEFQLAQFFAKDSVAPREQLVWLKPEAIAIDTVSLRQQVAAANPHNQLNELRIAQLDNSAKMLSYTATMRLTPFARWSTYLTSQNKISNNVDFGVRFTFPLWNATKNQKQSLEVQKDTLDTSTSQSVCQSNPKSLNSGFDDGI